MAGDEFFGGMASYHECDPNEFFLRTNLRCSILKRTKSRIPPELNLWKPLNQPKLRANSMFKTALLISLVFILCSCASTDSSIESTPTEAVPVSAQTDSIEPGANPELAGAGGDAEQTQVDDPNKEFCTKEHRTGSRIPVKYCRTKADDERNREHSKGWLEKVKKTPQHSVEVG